MKILYLVPFVPWEIRVRSFNLIPRLARRHEIYLVCVSGAEPTTEQREWLNRYCRRTMYVRHPHWRGLAQALCALPTKTPLRMAYAHSKAAQTVVQNLYEEVRPDVVYLERWRALEFLPRKLSAPIVCDPTDSMMLYNRRLMERGAWWEKVVGWEEYTKFRREEGELAGRADAVVFCSRVDLDCVRRQAPGVRYTIVPNGVDCDRYWFKSPRDENPAQIVFTGSLKYRPNRHAVEFFLRGIFPEVRKSVPDATFLVVGNGAPKALTRFRDMPGVHVLDFVPDLRPYLAQATVAVAPLTIGAGVSNKLGEGFAVGTPVVATPLACGDLPVQSGDQLLIAENPEQFTAHVVTLLKDPDQRRQIAARARRFVQHYDWGVIAARMEDLLRDIAGLPADPSKDPLVPAEMVLPNSDCFAS